MLKKPLFIGNWKMNIIRPADAVRLATSIASAIKNFRGNKATVAVCPSYIGIASLQKSKLKPVLLGAQDCFWEESGAYTGEVSVKELTALGCSLVILGHSERRKYLGETDEIVHLKVASVVEGKGTLVPVVCVGETSEEYRQGMTLDVIRRQLKAAFSGVVFTKKQEVIIAYEPVWAIGTGKACSPGDCAAVYTEVMALFALWYPDMIQQKRVFVIYGGSVNKSNVRDFVREGIADGVLVGGASLRSREFVSLISSVK